MTQNIEQRIHFPFLKFFVENFVSDYKTVHIFNYLISDDATVGMGPTRGGEGGIILM